MIKMETKEFIFQQKKVTCYFDRPFDHVQNDYSPESSVIVTDYNVYKEYHQLFAGYKVIKLAPGEENKTQASADYIISRMLEWELDRHCNIIAVGGGVVTDLAGYVASIYKRGVKLVLVPTTILGMVDAAIGGKNGINVSVYKNMVGTIYQPESIIYDYRFLESLPVAEWVNGFAEIIKHACIKDELLFKMLERYELHDIRSDLTLAASLVEQNVAIKMGIVLQDELEKADRMLLNFGHTIGHAIENLHHLPHGHAVSIGMVAECGLSEQINQFHFSDAARIVTLLSRYHLPVDIETDVEKVFDVLKADKKREAGMMHVVMLNNIGDAVTKPVSLNFLHDHLKKLLS